MFFLVPDLRWIIVRAMTKIMMMISLCVCVMQRELYLLCCCCWMVFELCHWWFDGGGEGGGGGVPLCSEVWGENYKEKDPSHLHLLQFFSNTKKLKK